MAIIWISLEQVKTEGKQHVFKSTAADLKNTYSLTCTRGTHGCACTVNIDIVLLGLVLNAPLWRAELTSAFDNGKWGADFLLIN